VAQERSVFFRRWGALAVFFARFVPPIRAFVPVTAGALGMTPLRFLRPSISRRSCYGAARACAAGRAGDIRTAPLRRNFRHHTGIGKHYWMLSVLGGALIVGADGLGDPSPKGAGGPYRAGNGPGRSQGSLTAPDPALIQILQILAACLKSRACAPGAGPI